MSDRQAPAAWQYVWPNGDCFTTTTEAAVRNYAQGAMEGLLPEHCGEIRALYPAPPRREWVSLTRDEVADIALDCYAANGGRFDDFALAAAIEAALKDKNHEA